MLLFVHNQKLRKQCKFRIERGASSVVWGTDDAKTASYLGLHLPRVEPAPQHPHGSQPLPTPLRQSLYRTQSNGSQRFPRQTRRNGQPLTSLELSHHLTQCTKCRTRQDTTPRSGFFTGDTTGPSWKGFRGARLRGGGIKRMDGRVLS